VRLEFGLTPGERKEDIDAETAEHYKQAFLNNGMRPLAITAELY
jgi:hypothetical protein